MKVRNNRLSPVDDVPAYRDEKNVTDKQKEMDTEVEKAQRRWNMARAAVVAQLPSSKLHHSNQGTSLGRRARTAKREKRRMSIHGTADLARRRQNEEDMEMKLMKEAQKRGLTKHDDSDDDDEEVDELDKLKQMDLIREMPVSLQAKKNLKEALMKTMPQYDDTGCSGWLYRRRVKTYLSKKKGKKQWKEFGQYFILWNTAFKRIEGHQGSSVLTYFTFLKWLFIINIVIFLSIFIFLVVPTIAFPRQGYNQWVIANTSSVAVTQADTCSAIYSSNLTSGISPAPADLILNFIEGTGWMENTAMFYGFYPNELVTFTSTYGYNISVAYLVVMLMYFLFSLILIVGKTSFGFRERLFSGSNGGSQFCNLVFAAWDYNIHESKNANIRCKTNYMSIVGQLRERERKAKIRSRTTSDKVKLYTIRILVNILIFASLGGAGYLIYFSTVQTVELESSPAYNTYHQLVQLLIQYLTSLTITVLNAILPTIYKRLVNFEHLSPSGSVSITLFRTVFLKLASLAILLISIYSKVTCTPQDECRVGTGTCTSVTCWETKVGQEIYKLTLTDFFVLIGVTFCVELPRWLIATKAPCKLAKKVPRQEFDIPKEVLGLIYGQTLLWFGSFFCPLIPVLVVMKNIITFYVKYLSSMVFYGPSTKPHSASDSDAFFMYVLLVAYVLCVLPIGYCIWMIPPSRSCGPFRLYDKIYDILTFSTTTYPQWFQDILAFVQSSIFEFTAIVILSVAIFYLVQIIQAYKGVIVILREQLTMEAQDKKFLLEKFQELSGDGPPKEALYKNNSKQDTPPVTRSQDGRPPSIEEIELPPGSGIP